MTLRTLNYGNYGIFLIMGNAGFCPSAVSSLIKHAGENAGHKGAEFTVPFVIVSTSRGHVPGVRLFLYNCPKLC